MFFDNLKTPEQIKARYFDLAKQHHPDHGGDLQTMQRINSEFAEALNAAQTASADQAQNTFDDDIPDQYISVLTVLFSIPDLSIELCGSWLWIFGNTYPARETLRDAGCCWSSSKKKWYWCPTGSTSRRRRTFTMEQIYSMYGSREISKAGGGRLASRSAALPSA